MTQEFIIILIMIIFLFILINKNSQDLKEIKESFENSSSTASPAILDAVKQVYQADIEAIRNLSSFASTLNSNGSIIIPANVTIQGNLTVNGTTTNQGKLTVNNDAKITGKLTVDSTASFSNNQVYTAASPNGSHWIYAKAFAFTDKTDAGWCWYQNRIMPLGLNPVAVLDIGVTNLYFANGGRISDDSSNNFRFYTKSDCFRYVAPTNCGAQL